jgi:hypothetical protein
VTEHDFKTVYTIHAVSSANDMKECVGNFGYEFAEKRNTFRVQLNFWRSRGLRLWQEHG